jgi:hypothetical protein
VPRIVLHNVTSLEVIIEEDRSLTVKKIDLQAFGRGKSVTFAVQVQTTDSFVSRDDTTTEMKPLTCHTCFCDVALCICELSEGTRLA